MRAGILTLLCTLAAMLDMSSAVAQQSPSVAGPDEDWTTYLEFKRLNPGVAASPEKATMSDRFTNWTIREKAPVLPPELRRREFDNESYILVDVDPSGKKTGCRPLRTSGLPRLDALSCEFLMSLDYFVDDPLPGAQPSVTRQMVLGVKWRRVGPHSPRFTVAEPPPPEKKP